MNWGGGKGRKRGKERGREGGRGSGDAGGGHRRAVGNLGGLLRSPIPLRNHGQERDRERGEREEKEGGECGREVAEGSPASCRGHRMA